MSLRRLLPYLVLLTVVGSACQPEAVVENLVAKGVVESSGIIISGSFKKDVAVTSNEYMDVRAHIIEAGSFTISTDTLNGFYFRGTGSKPDTGLITVRLYAHGTPISTGTHNFKVRFGTSTCPATVIVNGDPASSNATFTLGKLGNNCTGTTITGVYMQVLPMNTLNTVKIDVTVITPGTFTISTNTLNGVSFSATGNFPTPGAQRVTLYGNGTPATTGNYQYQVTVGSQQCLFPITYSSSTTPAVFSTNGNPGQCNPIVINGTYKAGTALNSINTAVIEVMVTTPGTYSISTGTAVNGMTFTGAGVFTTPGVKTIILHGTGTPLTAGSNQFTIPGTGGCLFTINTQPSGGTSSGMIACKIDGVPTTFNIDAHAFLAFPTPSWGQAMEIAGFATATGSHKFVLDINRTVQNKLIEPGTYGQGIPGTITQFYYYTPAAAFWYGISTTNPVTIVVTSITANNVKGTFQGRVYDGGGWGSTFKTITEGTFDVPTQ